MSKIKSIIAAIALTAVSAASHATVIKYTTSAYANSTGGGSGANATTGLFNVALGQLLNFSTSASQYWAGAVKGDGNYAALYTDASGSKSSSWSVVLSGSNVRVGTLVGEIGGVYRAIGAGDVALTAWNTGTLHLWYADSNYGDNSGTMNTTLTVNAVPEPGTLAMMGLGLLGLVGARRRRSK